MAHAEKNAPKTRITRQRMVILEELRKLKTHPTADELYGVVRRRLPRISLGTVYRNLDLLAETNQVRKLESAGSMRRFDGDMSPHHHVRCVHCGRVADVSLSMGEHPALPLVKVHGFEVLGARVEYDGVCAECQSSAV